MEGKFQANSSLHKSDVNYNKNASKHGCPEHYLIATAMEASVFSYNDMSCACQECMGKGVTKTVHPSKVIKNPKKTLRQGPFFPEVYSMSHSYSEAGQAIA